MLRSLLTASLALLVIAFKQPPPPKHFSIQRLAPGVWAAIQNDKGGFAISNAGIVDLGQKTLVFDAFINPDAAAELKQAAEALTHHPVSFVVNSHYHDDHVRGDQVFKPGASVISTEWTRNEIKKAEPEEREWARKNIGSRVEKARAQLRAARPAERDEAVMWLGYYRAIAQSLSKLKLVLPDVTFKDSMQIHGTERSVLLVECHYAHTASDLVMILPKEGIAFMGDVLFVNRHPWFGDGDPDSLKKHLQRFYEDASLVTFVPGHGPVGKKESLQTLIQYINDLQALATGAVEKDEPDSVFIQRPVPVHYKAWWYDRFYSDNLQAVYDRAKASR